MIAKTRDLLKLARQYSLWDNFSAKQNGVSVGKLVFASAKATFILDLAKAIVESFGPWKWNPTDLWVRVKQARIERIGDLLYITGLWKNFTGANYAYQAITNLDGALQAGTLTNTSFKNIYSVPAYYPTTAEVNKLALRTVKIGTQRYGYLLKDTQYVLRYNYVGSRIAPFFPCNDNGVPTSMGNIAAWYDYTLPPRQEDFYDEYAVNFPKLPSDFGMHVLGEYAYYSTSAGVAYKIGSDGAPTTNPTHTYVISGYVTSLFPNQPTIVGVSGSYLVGTLLSTNTHTASITAGSGVRTESAFLQVLGLFNADMSLHKVISTCHYNASGAIGSNFNKVIVSSKGNIYWLTNTWKYRVQEVWVLATVGWRPSDFPNPPVGYYTSSIKDRIDSGELVEYNQGVWRWGMQQGADAYVLQPYSVIKGFNGAGDAIPSFVSPSFEYDYTTYPFNIVTLAPNGTARRAGRVVLSTLDDDEAGNLYIAAYGVDFALYGRWYSNGSVMYPYLAKYARNGVPLAFDHGITGALTVDSVLCIGDKVYVGGTPTSGEASPLRRLNAATGEIDPYVP
jgi:hypothetical protein